MTKSAWPLTRSIFACVIGTLVATACMFISLYIRKSFVAQSFIEPMPFVADSLKFAIAIACTVLLCLLVIGLPVQSVMQKERVTGYIWHVLPAMVFGGVLFTGVITLLNPLDATIELSDIIRGTGLGFISSSVAWFIRRPDLDGYDKVLATINGKYRSGQRRKSRAGLAQSRAARQTQ